MKHNFLRGKKTIHMTRTIGNEMVRTTCIKIISKTKNINNNKRPILFLIGESNHILATHLTDFYNVSQLKLTIKKEEKSSKKKRKK